MAYRQPGTTTLKVARIFAMTLVAMTVVIGIIVLMGIYINRQHGQCACSPLSERLQDSRENDILAAAASKVAAKKAGIPLKLHMDENTGQLMKNNHKAHVNCVIERKKATQLVSRGPKMLVTSYGNITTDPKLLHITGERMIFSCFSGVKMMESPLSALMSKGSTKEFNERKKRSATGAYACDCAC